MTISEVKDPIARRHGHCVSKFELQLALKRGRLFCNEESQEKKKTAPAELEWRHREQARNTSWGFQRKAGYQESYSWELG